MNSFDDREIAKEVDVLFEKAEKERYIHSKSEEVFDAIAGLWLLGDDFEAILGRIGRAYLISLFLLKYLKMIYTRIRKDYDLPKFGAIDLTDEKVCESFRIALERLKSDMCFMEWFRNNVFSVCERLSADGIETSLDDLSRIGNLSDSTLGCAKKDADKFGESLWLWDCLFQFDEALIGVNQEEKLK